MEKLDDFIKGVSITLPGIIVAVIFFMFTNAEFGEFFFLIFCIIAMGVVRLLRDVFLFIVGTIDRWLIRPQFPNIVAELFGPDRRARLGLEFIIAILCGLVLAKAYEDDLFFEFTTRLVQTERISSKTALDMMLVDIRNKNYARLDGRRASERKCRMIESRCEYAVFVRIMRGKEYSDYEGYFRYFSARGEEKGLFLSPACVVGKSADGIKGAMEPVPGPGVFITASEIKTIELVDITASWCAGFFYTYGTQPAAAPAPPPRPHRKWWLVRRPLTAWGPAPSRTIDGLAGAGLAG